MLTQLDSLTDHLDNGQTEDLVALIKCFPSVFNTIPSMTTVLEHDVNVAGVRVYANTTIGPTLRRGR